MVEKSGRPDPYRQAIIDNLLGGDLPPSLSAIEVSVITYRYRTKPPLTFDQISQGSGIAETTLKNIEARAIRKILRPQRIRS
ncbi:MAG: hypothetical protein Q7S88_02305 [Candidatus Daviesbacteria bacterium]|nr:hypothetical protein [Candidatus Daviesbacteria bacterium]